MATALPSPYTWQRLPFLEQSAYVPSNFLRIGKWKPIQIGTEGAAVADSDIKLELTALRLEVIKQIAIADRLGEPHLAAILCEAEVCIDKLIAE